MKKRGFLIVALLFSLLSTVLFTACEPTSQTLRDPSNLRPSVSATIKQEFPLNIDLAAFNQSIQGSELREATGRVLYHSALKWDLEEICRKAGFSSDKLKQLEIQEITIKAQAPVDYNVGFFRKLSVFLGEPLALFAESDDEKDQNQITFVLKQTDLLPLLKSGGLPIKLVTTQMENAPVAESLTLLISFKGVIKIEQ